MESLNTTASQVQAKTKKSLDKWDDGPTPRQIMESQRVMETATECLEEMVVRGVGNLHIQGEPILLLQVEVNRPLKQAKVYWTLPYGVLLDDRISKTLYRKFMDRLQEHVEAGDAKLLQRQVHARLRSYYPPRLKLVQATEMMVHEAMLELMDEDVWKKSLHNPSKVANAKFSESSSSLIWAYGRKMREIMMTIEWCENRRHNTRLRRQTPAPDTDSQ